MQQTSRAGIQGSELAELFDEYNFARAPHERIVQAINLYHGRPRVWYSEQRDAFILEDGLSQYHLLPTSRALELPRLIQLEAEVPGTLAEELSLDGGSTKRRFAQVFDTARRRIKERADQLAAAEAAAREMNKSRDKTVDDLLADLF